MNGEDGGKWNSEAHRKQRRKNIALFVVLAAFALLFYLITVVRLGGNVLSR